MITVDIACHLMDEDDTGHGEVRREVRDPALIEPGALEDYPEARPPAGHGVTPAARSLATTADGVRGSSSNHTPVASWRAATTAGA